MIRFSTWFSAVALLCIGLATAGEVADQSGDVDNEITRLRKELQQIETQRQKNKQDMESEQRDFAAYRDRTDKRLTSGRMEIDSLKGEISHVQKRSDSLAALIQSAQLNKREIELSRDALRSRILGSCDKLDTEALCLSPQSRGQLRSSIALVKSDLQSKTIECPEAFARLTQIIALMRDATGSIQAGSENSPIADIRGTAERLRVGCLMDAVADSKGGACYLWNGNNPDGSPAWKPCADKTAGAEIVHAVAVREGKALPSFVNLPLTAVQKAVAP